MAVSARTSNGPLLEDQSPICAGYGFRSVRNNRFRDGQRPNSLVYQSLAVDIVVTGRLIGKQDAGLPKNSAR